MNEAENWSVWECSCGCVLNIDLFLKIIFDINASK
jgi:hypothetical protein